MHRVAGDTEVGQLRTVLLHRPGNELKRLTPRNYADLLFDGLPWVGRAQEEHDAFAQALRDRGAEVLYVSDLVARDARRTRPRAIGARRRDPSRVARADARRGASGATSTTPTLMRSPSSRSPGSPMTSSQRATGLLGGWLGRTSSSSAAAQPAVHPRLQCLDRRSRHHHAAVHARRVSARWC